MYFSIKEALDAVCTPLYALRGRRPWSLGYYTKRKLQICEGIDSGAFATGKALPAGYGSRMDERVVEYPWIYANLPSKPGRLLDAGSALNFGFLLERKPVAEADLAIMTLAPEKRCYWKMPVSYIYGDLRKTFFADASFDAIVSISTIEHIGLDNTMLYTADSSKMESDALGFIPAVIEYKRILKPGGVCLITVPFGRRGVHGWFQVFDLALINKVIEAFQPSNYSTQFFGYQQDGWRYSTPEQLTDAQFFDINVEKAFASDFAAGARGVACIRLEA